jgi:hypothetical protein
MHFVLVDYRIGLQRDVFFQAYRTEGVGVFYSGWGAAVLRQAVYGGIGTAMYVPLRTAILGEGVDPADAPLWKKALTGFISGAVGQAIAAPTDVVKTRLQADGKRRFILKQGPGASGGAESSAPRYRGTLDAFRVIWRTEGLAGLYRGVLPSVQRAGVINAAGMAAYDHTKHWTRRTFFPHLDAQILGATPGIRPAPIASASDAGGGAASAAAPGLLGHAAAALSPSRPPVVEALQQHQRADIAARVVGSLVSGLISAVVASPLDVVRTRLQNQTALRTGRGAVGTVAGSVSAAQLYTGTIDCLIKTVRGEGFLALYKGFLPSYARLAPWQITFFLVYEEVARIMGLGKI